MNKNILRIALIQSKASDNPKENLKNTLKKIDQAAKKGAKIVCLQELFSSKYFPQAEDSENFSLAETIPGNTTSALSKSAKKNKITLIGSIFEKRAQGVYHNTAVVFGQSGKIISAYRKMHIPDDPRYYEKYYFTPGDLGFTVTQTKNAKIGTLICWDQWYPEAARIESLSGAQIIFYPTAIGWHKEES